MFPRCFETGYRTFCRAHACRDHLLPEASTQARRKHFIHDGLFDFELLVRRRKTTTHVCFLQERLVLMLNRLILRLSHFLPPQSHTREPDFTIRHLLRLLDEHM